MSYVTIRSKFFIEIYVSNIEEHKKDVVRDIKKTQQFKV